MFVMLMEWLGVQHFGYGQLALGTLADGLVFGSVPTQIQIPRRQRLALPPRTTAPLTEAERYRAARRLLRDGRGVWF